MKIGKTYDVEIYDCCVKGKFTSKLVKMQQYDDDSVLQDVESVEDEYGTHVFFENGVELAMNGGVSLTEVDCSIPLKGA